MKFDRNIRMHDEEYTPVELDRFMKKGNLHKAKFLDSRFHYSQYLQMKVIHELGVKRILEIGPGENFIAGYMRGLDLVYDTLDNTKASNPTILSDFRDWHPKIKLNYDLVCAFQVLEHMPFDTFASNIRKMASVSNKYILISLPYHCFGFRMKLFFSFGQMKRYIFNFSFHIPTFFKNRVYRKEYVKEFPFAVHFWEIGRRNFYPWTIDKILKEENLTIEKKFHSTNPYHYFYLLSK